MAVSQEDIKAEIKWYNEQIVEVKDNFVKWLVELGHELDVSEKKIEKEEKLSGIYSTYQFVLKIDKELEISLIPYGIWIVGAKGRIDILGPAGSEKLVYFFKGGPAITVTTELGNSIKSHAQTHVSSHFSDIDTKGWYWYNDSAYRKATKFGKEIIEPLLETVQ